jgi:hypothetical protein
MRGRVVHRVYAEDEPQELGDGDRPLMQPAWDSPRRSRAMAIALLVAGVAFVMALAIRALSGPGAVVGRQRAMWAGSQATPVATAHGAKARRRSEKTAFHSAHERRARRRAVSEQARPAKAQRRMASAPRAEERAVAYSSAAQAAPAVAARSAESEFSFER